MLSLKLFNLFVCCREITYWVKSVAHESMFCLSRISMASYCDLVLVLLHGLSLGYVTSPGR